MASRITLFEGKISLRQSCDHCNATTQEDSTRRSSSFVFKEEELGSIVGSSVALYATSTTKNNILILVSIAYSFEVLEKGRFIGLSKYIVQNGTKLTSDESLPGVDLIAKIGFEILKVPIKYGYILTPTFSVVS